MHPIYLLARIKRKRIVSAFFRYHFSHSLSMSLSVCRFFFSSHFSIPVLSFCRHPGAVRSLSGFWYMCLCFLCVKCILTASIFTFGCIKIFCGFVNCIRIMVSYQLRTVPCFFFIRCKIFVTSKHSAFIAANT